MNMYSLSAAIGLALATGCATNARKIHLANEASLRADSHKLWTRPTEIGFKMGKEISATAQATSVLGFQTGESKNSSVGLAIVTSALGGKGASLSGTGNYAAYKAVMEAGAEGIYVTRVESENFGFFFFVKNEKVTVYGRALTMHDYGPIAESRSDDWRFRNFQPKTVVIKGGGSTVQVKAD
jgi:hypothetical protein